MTLEEAKKVAAVASEADGGCPHCVNAMCEDLKKAFPEFLWEYDDEADPRIRVMECAPSSPSSS